MRRVWVVLRVIGSVLLLAFAAFALVGSIITGHYDPQENRAPTERIVVAAIAFIPALVALRLMLPAADTEHPRRRTAAWAGMAFLSLFFLLGWWIIALSNGST
jgi:hypothetical protein